MHNAVAALRLNSSDIRARANGHWPSILSSLGIQVPSSPKQHGRCPTCGGKDRFRFDDLDGNGSWYCNQCAPTAGDGFALVQNVRGCGFTDALQLVADAVGYHPINGDTPRKISTTYDYTGEDGALLFQVVRYEPKDFRQRRPDGHGGWTPNLNGVETILYKLPKVLKSDHVLIVEGEKDVETACRLGLPDGWAATCNPMGAGKWRDSYSDALQGKHVVILPDADKPGEKHAAQVAQSLQGKAATVLQLTLPDGVKDLSVWAEDRTQAEFHTLLSQAAPLDHAIAVAPTLNTALPHDSWPALDTEALYGLAGEVVRLYEPHTEADSVALLVSFVSEVGVMVGRVPHLILDGGYHPLLFWPVLVGKSSKSRKGTADRRIDTLCQLIDPAWTRGESKGTLSSGEGLAYAVRDAQYKEEPVKQNGKPTGEIQTICIDSGVKDKRLFLVQSEFGAVLRVMEREGNSLSGVLRDAWDGKDLIPMTKANRVKATAPHIGIVAHVTKDELLRNLNSTEASNGFGNRFAWFAVQRSKELPFPSSPDHGATHDLSQRIHARIQTARTITAFSLSARAREAWKALYHDLSAERPGLAGDLLGRAEAQVMRLAALYALLDGVSVIDLIHLRPACALWQYAEASTRYIFGDNTGDRYADTILRALSAQGDMADTAISALFGRNAPAARLGQAKAVLVTAGLAHSVSVSSSGGRDQVIWSLGTKKTN